MLDNFVKPKVIIMNPGATPDQLKDLVTECLKYNGYKKEASEFAKQYKACKTHEEVVMLMFNYVEEEVLEEN